MISCFAHTYTLPFETFFQKAKDHADPIEVCVVSSITMEGENFHKAPDFPGGPLLEISENDKYFTLNYAEYGARLLKKRIDISGPLTNIGRITQVLERVIFPIHLQLFSPNLVPLHGGAVLFDDRAYVFIGESGMGKSTTVRELVKRGAKIISDDLIFIDTNSMHLLPGLPTLRLLEKAEFSLRHVERVGPKIEKWWHLLDQEQLQNTIPIQNIFSLKPGEDLFRVIPKTGFSKTAALLSQTFAFTNAGTTREQMRFGKMSEVAISVKLDDLCFRKGTDGPIHIDKLASYLSTQ